VVVAAASSAVCAACGQATFIRDGKCVACSERPGPGWFALVVCSYEADASWQRCTAACPPGAVQRAPCTNVTDLECGWPAGDTRCSGVPLNPTRAPDWLTTVSPCPRGQYLYGFRSLTDKDCRLCPADTTSVDGYTCERCAGVLEEPYFLDRSLCVCKPPAVMLGGGGCACPAGWRQNGSRCEPCPAGTHKPEPGGGGCEPCPAGMQAGGSVGSTGCEACASGLYRIPGNVSTEGCVRCPLAGWYAPDRTRAVCVPCNRSCGVDEGWTDAGPCPGADESAGWRVCAPCPGLPEHAAWLASAPGSCIYECDAGYYRDGGGCARCSTGACEAGRRWEDCSLDADRRCDAECVNASKPLLNARWATSGSRDCPWECAEGFALVRTDYWVFVLEECVAIGPE
jgi:hypothetical protein